MLIFFLVTKDKESKTGVRGNIIYPFLQFFRMWRHQYLARHMIGQLVRLKQGQLGRKILFMHHATLYNNLTICGLP